MPRKWRGRAGAIPCALSRRDPRRRSRGIGTLGRLDFDPQFHARPGKAWGGHGKSACFMAATDGWRMPLMKHLAAAGFSVGDNEPYAGALEGDTPGHAMAPRPAMPMC